ncbi:MAG: hypothetical protein JWM59_3459 [Verrucomicrobiales bacterium]|nr:hypothetical protein [Verrucomicrobiales bacterium]
MHRDATMAVSFRPLTPSYGEMNRKTAPLKFHRHLDASAYYGVTGAAIGSGEPWAGKSDDPFPQENPMEVVRWYGRHFRKSAPSKLIEAAQRWSGKEFPLMDAI